MLNADETAELRALRAKAYGPGDGLTAAELVRLQQLEGAVPHPPTGSEIGGVTTAVAEPVEVPEGGVTTAVVEPVDVPEGGGARRRALIVTAPAALVALGLGIGWGIWGQHDLAIPLTEPQRTWQEDVIAAGEYRSGIGHPGRRARGRRRLGRHQGLRRTDLRADEQRHREL